MEASAIDIRPRAPGLLGGPATPAAAASADPARERQLREAARQFESLFVSILLESMRGTVPESGLLEQGTDLKIYRQMHDQALADAIGGRGGLGIADMLVQKLGAEAAAEAAVRPTASARPPSGQSAPGVAAPEPWLRPSAPAAATPPAAVEARTFVAAPAPAADPALVLSAAPAPARALAGYRLQTELDEQVARMTRLRNLAEREGGAAADSLRRWEGDISRAAEETGVDPALLLAVMVRESGGNPEARSPQGALGLMQLMPGTAREVGVERPQHPAQNVLGGARYLARMLRGHGRKLDLALAAYNAGPGAVAAAGGRVPPYRETRKYVDGVMALYRRLGGSGSEAPAAKAAGARPAALAAEGGS